MTAFRHTLGGLVCSLALLGAACAARVPGGVAAPPASPGAPVNDVAPSPVTLAAPPHTQEAELDSGLLVGVLATTELGLMELPSDLPRADVEATELLEADIDIPLNERVRTYVDLFTGRLKGYLEDSLGRGERYLPMIREVFRAEGLPLDLVYVPIIESAFRPTAVSRAKATGLWQFMRGTALENGLKHDWYIDERADPEKATRAAANYLKTLYGMFDDWYLALASYNAGPGRVQRAIKRAGQADFWKLSASSRYLPRETRDYVPLILAAITIARNPADYDLTITPFEESPYETVTLDRPVDLRRVAEWTATSVESIQSLNPELRRRVTPIGVDDYTLKVPPGSAAIVTARLAELPPEEVLPITWYTVKKGDTLWGVSRRFDVSLTELAEANQLSSKARLAIGQTLMVPGVPSLAGEAPQSRPGAPDAVLVSATDSAGSTVSPTIHRVRRGDTLSSIARRYRTTVASIKQLNGLQTDLVRPNQRLRVSPPTLSTH